MLLRSRPKEIEAATPAPSFLPDVLSSQKLPWLKLPLLHIPTWTLPRALFPVNTITKQQIPSSVQQESQAEQMQSHASGDAAEPEAVPPTGTRTCYVSTSHNSQLLLFLSPTMDAKHILSKCRVVL